ncbi:hypothetical protein QYE76_062307 [Lolium multiflorum]|uniref:Uncharacterized protein n=1 Tax=Lolium multiflorum TaxID=4521 RepID=A0AAD8S5G6_LOLMU|nr:hypothetical protein QYE76_062307 [Lolium multiflorum]
MPPPAKDRRRAAPGSRVFEPLRERRRLRPAAAGLRRPRRRCGREKATGLLGRITELKREGRELGHFLGYAEKWNQRISPRLRAAWGKTGFQSSTRPAPRALKSTSCGSNERDRMPGNSFRGASSEHPDSRLSPRQAIPEASIEALKVQVAALQADKEQLIRKHQEALDAQKDISRELKDQAIQAGIRMARS